MTSSSAATPPASGTPMDLIGKTVQWEYEGQWLPLRWFTATIDSRADDGTYTGTVVNPGNYRGLTAGELVYHLKPGRCTVIDSEPDTDDPERE